MSFDPTRDRTAVLSQAGHGLEAVEAEAFALRYAVLVVERDGHGSAAEHGARLRHAAEVMVAPGSPPMALLAVGAFEGPCEVDGVGEAVLPCGARLLAMLVAPGESMG